MGKQSKHVKELKEMPEPILDQEFFSNILAYNKSVIGDVVAAAFQLIKPYLASEGMEFSLEGKTYCLHPDAPGHCVMAASALMLMDWLPFIVANGNTYEIANSYLVVGLCIWPSLAAQTGGKSITSAIATYKRDTKSRKRGGHHKPKWTPKVEKLARSIFEEVKDGKQISIDAACQRTMTQLFKKYGIKISKSTIRHYLAELLPSKS